MNSASTRRASMRALPALVLTVCTFLSGCIVLQPREPTPPSPLRTATSLKVDFDYSGLMVAGMGSPKSEAEWVAAKTAEDPEYPKTWADLKSKWEENFMIGLSGGSPVPVSRASAAVATSAATSAQALAQADVTAPPADAAPTTQAAPPPAAALATDAQPVPAEPAAAPFDGTAIVKVSVVSLQLGKYIPLYVTKAEISASNTWWVGGKLVEESRASADYRPTLTSPSVFQHVQVIGRAVGEQTAKFLRKKMRS
jgi:hypothetical protein